MSGSKSDSDASSDTGSDTSSDYDYVDSSPISMKGMSPGMDAYDGVPPAAQEPLPDWLRQDALRRNTAHAQVYIEARKIVNSRQEALTQTDATKEKTLAYYVTRALKHPCDDADYKGIVPEDRIEKLYRRFEITEALSAGVVAESYAAVTRGTDTAAMNYVVMHAPGGAVLLTGLVRSPEEEEDVKHARLCRWFNQQRRRSGENPSKRSLSGTLILDLRKDNKRVATNAMSGRWALAISDTSEKFGKEGMSGLYDAMNALIVQLILAHDGWKCWTPECIPVGAHLNFDPGASPNPHVLGGAPGRSRAWKHLVGLAVTTVACLVGSVHL